MGTPVNRSPDEKCQHCKHRKVTQARGLCSICYFNRRIRKLYKPAFTKDLLPHDEEGIEKRIAEQLANLPPWWNREVEKQKRQEESEVECRCLKELEEEVSYEVQPT